MTQTDHTILTLPTSTAVLAETIKGMGKAAREAAELFAVREWASVLAAKAGQRNYVGQLRALFDDIARRWRYVGEPGEWIHGGAKSLVRTVLGTKYNGDPDLDKTPLHLIPAKNKGWGDCDDVSEIVAAGVISLGMTPFFRVVMTGTGGHVSVVARTQRGELVSLDPVGLPEHPFGWMLPARPDQITYYDMQAAKAPALGACDCSPEQGRNKTAILRAARTFKPFTQTNMHYARSYPGIMPPNILAVKAGGYLSSIDCLHGLAAVDEYGRTWMFNGHDDLWEAMPLGKFGDRLKGAFKKVRNVVKKVRALHNKIVSKILASKVGQRLVGTALMAWGVPPTVAPAVMQVASELIKKGGLIGLLKMLRKKPGGLKAAMQLIAAAAKKGLIATGLVPKGAQQYLKGMEKSGYSLVAEQNGEVTPVWPIAAIIEIPLGGADFIEATKVPDTAAETKNVQTVASTRPTSSRGQSQKAGQADADWLSNVVLWETYPSSPLVLDTKNKSHKPYIQAWVRINNQVRNNLAVKKSGGGDSFVMNASENEIARQTAVEKPKSVSHRGANQSQKSGQSLQDWLSNAAYYRAYPDGPTKLDQKVASHKNYVNAWRRIAATVKGVLGATTPKTTTPKTTPKKTTPTTTTPKTTTPKTTPKKTTPTTTTPKTTTPSTTPAQSTNCWEDDVRQQSICQDVLQNPEERSIAMAVASERPKSELVHGTTVYQGTKNDLDWLTNVAYYRAYPEGPVEIPASAPQYAEAWNRLRGLVRSSLKPVTKTPKIPTKPKSELPDLDPQELACLRSGGQWDAGSRVCRSKSSDLPIEPPKKSETPWLPIAAGLIGLALAMKG